ncbi:MAG TPA: hypothetical protein VFS21_33520 [Roseiflexaceae bacterium]|nr:hypothetical protein [Roseiflexaceae bacterium]
MSAPRHNPRILVATPLELLRAEVAAIETFGAAIPRVVAKAAQLLVQVDALEAPAAMILKQELLARGADALISPAVYLGDRDATTDALIFASLRALRETSQRLALFPLPALQVLGAELAELLAGYERGRAGELPLAGELATRGQRTLIVGDGAEGSDLLWVEQERAGAPGPLLGGPPVIAATGRAELARAALDAGAALLADPSGLRLPDGGWNQALLELAAAREAALLVCADLPADGDVAAGLLAALRPALAEAERAGVAPGRLLAGVRLRVAAGRAQIGQLLRRLEALLALGCPLLLDIAALPPDPPRDTALITLAAGAGVDLIRVADPAAGRAAARAADALARGARPAAVTPTT